ncbi:MAG: GH116 family glycosyl-hydrolase, partial [Gemmatimonadales bacterium]
MDMPRFPQTRRSFVKSTALGASGLALTPLTAACTASSGPTYRTEEFLSGAVPGDSATRTFNGPYAGTFLDRIAFPLGGIGAGMVCLEGTGALSHLSVRNRPQVFNEPTMFAAISVRGFENGAKVLEGAVPSWKYFGRRGTGNGAAGTSYGLPRFDRAAFLARFPFATVKLEDDDIPLKVELTGWSPFIPGDADHASLPVAALEYRFANPTSASIEAVFSYNARNIMSTGRTGNSIEPIEGGFVLWQEASAEHPEQEGAFAVLAGADKTRVDHCWFRGGWWDPLTIAWKHIRDGDPAEQDPEEGACPGGSLSIPFSLAPGTERTIRLLLAWYVPRTDLSYPANEPCQGSGCPEPDTYVPWYAGRFKDIYEVSRYWRAHYDELRSGSVLFRDAFYDTTLPVEVVEAVAANLSILKSPTLLRQTDGRLWCFEGCSDDSGCCSGSCTHVWNYAQALPHLFPALERTLRQTEFTESQDDRGHQRFRSALPIRPASHDFHAAADGQLGGIMKMHREWRISGDTDWLATLWPPVKRSLDYCIRTWDPKGKGVLEEPHHNTYDIEFWGPDGMCTSFYLGALAAAVAMGSALGDDVSRYQQLLERGRAFMETQL